jgi:hypothetical protein
VDEGKVDPWWAAEALAAHFGLRRLKQGEGVPPEHAPLVAALAPLERRTLIASRVFPLRRVVDSVELAIENPLNEAVLTQIGSVLGAVVDASREFVKNNDPVRGIIIGTKTSANPARGRIYKALARKAAGAVGGTVHELDIARGGMAAPTIVWLDKQHKFGELYQGGKA